MIKNKILGGGHKKIKKAFTLVELSVVIVIISIMLSTVLVSKSLINSAKINKIYEEYRTFNNSIKMFYDTYDCNAGDCKPEQIADLVTASAGMSLNTVAGGACFTDNTAANGSFVSLKTNVIESITKRSCQFIELQLAGFITGIDPKYPTLTDSIAGKNIPYAKFNKIGAWDFRAYHLSGGDPKTNSYTFPIGLHPNPNIGGKHVLVLRRATTATGYTTDIAYLQGGPMGNYATDNALNASLSMALDLKFDDGLPFSGLIAANMKTADWDDAGSWSTKKPCTTIVNPFVDVNLWGATYKYAPSNDINKGCLVAFAVDLPSS
jgi:prepilin-type N-terminal cleavage/methylation domain-containing protein